MTRARLGGWPEVGVKTIARQIPSIDRPIRNRDDLRREVAFLQGQLASLQEKWDNSQNGEFRILTGTMIARTVEHTYVVDVGAYGRSGSNSYDLMRHFGWRGLLIEPNPRLLKKIENEFQGLDYKLENIAAAGYNGEATLHLGAHDEISSIHRHQTEHWGPVHETLQVKAERLPQIMARNDVPQAFGLLSIDAEGECANLLDDVLTAGYKPSWVIIEINDNGREIKSLDESWLSPFVSDQIKRLYHIRGQPAPNLILERMLLSLFDRQTL